MENLNGNVGVDGGGELNITNNKKLWNPKGFIVLSILFSFLPAAILYALNYGRIGLTKKRSIALIISFVTFAVAILVSFAIPGSVSKIIFYAVNIGAGAFMNNDQNKMFTEHLANGGRKASFLIPVILSVLASVVLLFIAFRFTNIPDNKLTYKGGELYYTKNVQKQEVEKLGTYLTDQGFFVEGNEVAFKIDKQSGTYRFSMVINKEYLEDKELEQTCKAMIPDMSTNVFNNSNVEIILSNDMFKPLKTITK